MRKVAKAWANPVVSPVSLKCMSTGFHTSSATWRQASSTASSPSLEAMKVRNDADMSP